MKATEQSIFLDKPETLETVSFRTTVWKDPDGNDKDWSFLFTTGCCLTEAFDNSQFETFKTRQKMIERFDALYASYRNKGFKTRDELGMKEVGNCHDEIFLNYRMQLIDLYLTALVKQCNIPPENG